MPMSDKTLRELMRGHGMRVTNARIMVLRYLQSVDGPRSHAEVHQELENAGFDRATIYRNLLDLTDAGLLRRSDLGDHVWRFEAIDPLHAESEEQPPHFVCVQCGTVTCLPNGAIRVQPPRSAPRALRKKRGVEIQLRGMCDSCSDAA